MRTMPARQKRAATRGRSRGHPDDEHRDRCDGTRCFGSGNRRAARTAASAIRQLSRGRGRLEDYPDALAYRAANGLGWGFDGMDGVIFGLISPLIIKEFALDIPTWRTGFQVSLTL